MDIIQKARKFAKEEYEKNAPGHQWDHVERVLEKALEIARNLENVDFEALVLAVIFHDISYASYETHVKESIKVAERFLRETGYPRDRIELIKEIMLNHSTPHREKVGDARLIEGKIIYDADKSILITTTEAYEKYYRRLYFDVTKRLVKRQLQNQNP